MEATLQAQDLDSDLCDWRYCSQLGFFCLCLRNTVKTYLLQGCCSDAGPISLWSGQEEKTIFFMGINNVFRNSLCCGHLPACLSLMCLALFPCPFCLLMYHFWYPLSFTAFCLYSSYTRPTCPANAHPPELYSAYPAVLALKEKASRKAANVSTSVCWF